MKVGFPRAVFAIAGAGAIGLSVAGILVPGMPLLGVAGAVCIAVVWLDLTWTPQVGPRRRWIGALWALALAGTWLLPYPRSLGSHLLVALIVIWGIVLWLTSWRVLVTANRRKLSGGEAH